MKNKITFLLGAFVFVFSFLLWSPNISLASTFDGGTGTIGSPFQISTCEQLQNINYYSNTTQSYPYLNSYFILTDDIDCRDTTTWNDGAGFVPIGGISSQSEDPFTGSFDGDDHIISNLFINRPTSYSPVGLFGYVNGDYDGPGEIKNVSLVDVDISGGSTVGGLVGILQYGSMSKSSVSGDIKGNTNLSSENPNEEAGGLVGYSSGSHIENTYATGSVSGGAYVGGLIGYTDNGLYTILNSYSDVAVSAIGTAGGLVGYAYYENIYNSFATGTVSGNDYIGGLVGYFNSEGYQSHVFNSGWYSYPGAEDIYGIGYDSSSGTYGEVTYRVYDKEYFYVSTFSFYYNWGYGAWDFTETPIWYTQGGALPKFTEYNYFDGGIGTEENPYQISSCEQLQNIRYEMISEEEHSYYYKLTDDIDCSETENWNDGAGFLPIGYQNDDVTLPFYGSFDGDHHVISNLYINRPADINNLSVGLFGYVSGDYGDGATITNVGLEDVDITGSINVGGLVGYTEYSTISKSYVTGNVSGNVDPNSGDFYNTNTGGLVGYNYFGHIENTYATGNVSGGEATGGLVGYTASNGCPGGICTIVNSYSDSNVVGKSNIGGLVGYDYDDYIYNSFATGTVNYNGPIDGEYYIGGLIGYLNGDSGTQYNVGGLSGWASYTGSQNIDGIGYYNTNDSQPFSTPGKMFFFNKNSPIFDRNNNTGYRWDFYPVDDDGTSIVWYEQGGALPAFTPYDYFDGGDGLTAKTPFLISSCEQLQNVRYRIYDEVYYYYKLTDDIDCSDTENWNDGKGFAPIGYIDYNSDTGNTFYPFAGSFDGDRHTISNLYINRPFDMEDFIDGKTIELTTGLFGYSAVGQIFNVGLENINIIGSVFTGGLVGYNADSEIDNSYVTGDVTGTKSRDYSFLGNTSTGGLVGYNQNSHIENTYATGTVTDGNNVGGLVGVTDADGCGIFCTIVNSYSNSIVIGGSQDDGSYGNIGGLVGYDYVDDIYDSFAFGTVNYNGSIGGEYAIGGLIGYLDDDGDLYTDYIHNSGWYASYSESPYIYGIGHDTTSGTSQDVTYRETNKEVFYSESFELYDNKSYSWDFYPVGVDGTPIIWYSQPGGLPKFTEGDWFAGGTGTAEDPFQVSTCEQLQNVRYKLGEESYYFELINDIDCEETRDWNDGTGFLPIGYENYYGSAPFFGSFDGQGYIISDLYEATSTSSGLFGYSLGLFGFVDGYNDGDYFGATITNVGLEDVDITGTIYVGGLVGHNIAGRITNSYVTGDVTGLINQEKGLTNQMTGGLVGNDQGGHIENTYMTGSVTGGYIVGGLVGYKTSMDEIAPPTIISSYTDASVTGVEDIGGLVGYLIADNIYNSYAVGTVHKIGGQAYMGGLVGYFESDDGSYEDYIYNSGWYNYLYPLSQNVDAIGYDSYLDEYNLSVSYTEYSKDSFYSMYHAVYQGEGAWDFYGGKYSDDPTWYEQLSDLPKFTASDNEYFDGGSGSADDPFEITTCRQLQNIGRMPSGDYYYTLMNDIDCGETINWNGGRGFKPIGSYTNQFTGTFDGDGYVISDLHIYKPEYVESDENWGTGLFGVSYGDIINVGLEGADIVGGDSVGGLVGVNWGYIENSYVSGNIYGSNFDNQTYAVGGLVGENNGGHIENTYSTGIVSSKYNNYSQYVGGLVGYTNGIPWTIVNSYSSSDVSWGYYVGGLVGQANMENIYNSFAVGNVSYWNNYGGGLVGYFVADGVSYQNYIYNSGWSNTSTGYGIGYDAYSGNYGAVTYENVNNTNFYSKTYNIYDTGENPWDFENVWIEHANTYPTLGVTSGGEGNSSPSVNAGSDKTITQPSSGTTLVGTATDSDGTIESVTWSYVSGPDTYNIVNETSLTTTITNLTTAGTYVFRLTATDDDGASSSDTVTVLVRTKSSGGGGGGAGGGGNSLTSQAISTSQNCLPGDMFDRNTGLPCATVTTSSNCLAGYLFDPTTGLACPGSTSSLSSSSSNSGTSCIAQGMTFTRTLKLISPRMSGSDVQALQTYLNCKGYNTGIVDGIFGSMTKSGVVAFQLAHGLVGDGIVGPLTQAMILANQ